MATILDRIDIKDYIWNYNHGLSGREVYQATIRTASNAFQIRWPTNMSAIGAHNMADASGERIWTGQTVEYVPSNLGANRGTVFYFICKDCGKRVKFLFFRSYLHAPLCRRCCNLPYRQPTRPERRISRYLHRHPEVARQILNSGIIRA
jgi:hypothetical protein